MFFLLIDILEGIIMFKIIIISIICLFIGLTVFQQIDPNVSVSNTSEVVSKDNDSKVTVTIEGEVVLPGNYKLQVSQTMQDLIDECGGLLESADKDAINLEAIIGERDYFYVPALSIYRQECEITSEVEKININTATAVQLATLNYISNSLAEKIVQYREENGDFETIEDIMNVSGIGRATYEKIRDYIKLK